MELWCGACLAGSSPAEKAKVLDVIQSMNIVPLDEKSAQEAGKIEAELLRSGLIIEAEDIMIAGIARLRGETIVTRDAHYTRIPGIRVLKY